MYTTFNFKTKKALKEALAKGEHLTVFQPNADLTGTVIKTQGKVYLEGPHYPAAHTWYAEAELVDGFIVKVK